MNEVTMNPPNAELEAGIAAAAGRLADTIDAEVMTEVMTETVEEPASQPQQIAIADLLRHTFSLAATDKKTRKMKKWAASMWYKMHNKPGDVKEVGGTRYIISPTGAWVKESQ